MIIFRDMKARQHFPTKCWFLLPIVFVVAVLVVLLGIRFPGYGKFHKNKPSTRAVLETPAKENADGLTQKAQLFVVGSDIPEALHPHSHIFALQCDACCTGSVQPASIHARASPRNFS
jgi:hypothetical protein